MLTLIDPPAIEPVTLEEVKAQSRVVADHEDLRIGSYIRTARQKLDGRDGLLGKCLITQSWSLTLDRFETEITLPLPPCISVDRVAYLNSASDEIEISPPAYRVTGLDNMRGAVIRAASGYSWPDVSLPAGVTIEFTAGFGDDPEDVPEPLRTAIAMHAAHLFEHRESVVMGSGFIAPMPHGYDDLIRDYRAWSF